MILASILIFALTRAEIIQRMRAPVITQSDGLVKVYASCDEAVRREYQGPVAGFVADTVQTLYRGLNKKSVHFDSPGIILRIGNERADNDEVIVQVETNDMRVVSRLFLKNPARTDRRRLRLEVTRGFYRAVLNEELSLEEATVALRRADPRLRVAYERELLEKWLVGAGDVRAMSEEEIFDEAEEMLLRMRKVHEPGRAAKRDILVFASRLNVYSPLYDETFACGANCISFRDAIPLARNDPTLRIQAARKAKEMPIFGGGRGEFLEHAALAYGLFLVELAKAEKTDAELEDMLTIADLKLKAAYAQAE